MSDPSATHPSIPEIDLEFVRAQFPAFGEPDLAGWSFFENAGGSYPCRQVIDRLQSFYTRHKVQPYFPYPASQKAGAAMDEAYERLAGHLGLDPFEVHLGPSTSQNTYVLERALRPLWEGGDNIVASNQDHEGNAGAWRRLADTGIEVREWSVDRDTGALDPQELERLIDERTRLVAFPHCSNVVAAINPVAAIVERAHAAGALAVVDGVAWAPHGLPDVPALGADIYLFSLYKTWGPHLGLMAIRRPLLERAANQSHYFNAGEPRYRLLPAGPDHAQIGAAAGVAEYLDLVHDHHFPPVADPAERSRRLGELFRRHETSLAAPLLAWLEGRDDVRLVGPADPETRAPTVSFVPLAREPEAVHRRLTERRIMAGFGHFYGVRPLEGMGIPPERGVVRLSFLHYTSPAEIDHLLEALEAVL